METLDKFLRRLDTLPVAISRVTKIVAAMIEHDLARTFALGQDPAGHPWKKRTEEPKDGHPILDATGALKGSRRTIAGDGEVVISYDDTVAVHHQYGTKDMPARELLPEKEIPREWERLIDEEVRKAIDEVFK